MPSLLRERLQLQTHRCFLLLFIVFVLARVLQVFSDVLDLPQGVKNVRSDPQQQQQQPILNLIVSDRWFYGCDIQTFIERHIKTQFLC